MHTGLPATQSSMLLLLLLALYILRNTSRVASVPPLPPPGEWRAAVTRRLVQAGAWADSHPRLVLNVACGAIASLSAFEVLCQEAFVNDWPAHLHHADQLREGRLDYASYMHYHGHNAYPAAFLYTYTSLLALTGGNIRAFQVVWAVVEVVSLRAMGETGPARFSVPPPCVARVCVLW
jgi:hypothetical protein